MEIARIRDWVSTNAPMLARLYENKYVGMAYDRFASLPPKQQKQVLMGVVGGVLLIFALLLFSSMATLWSYQSRVSRSNEMINMLLQHQKVLRDKSVEVAQLERNNQLAAPGAFKQHLQDLARTSSISPRMLQVEEREESTAPSDDPKASKDVRVRRALAKLSRVNLLQFKTFLENVEEGSYNLSITSLKVNNDDKIRGYMNAEIEVIAYLFPPEEGIPS